MLPSSRIVALCVLLTPLSALAGERPERKVLRAEDVREATRASADAEVRAASAEAIARLEQLLRGGVGDEDTRAEMVMRLADLRAGEGRARLLEEMERYGAAFDLCFNTEGCKPDEIVADHSASLEQFDRALALYGKLLDARPTHARADEATFFRAQLLIQRADLTRDEAPKEEATRELVRLVRTWPSSASVTDAYLLLGELYFERGEVMRALPAYQRAAADASFAQRDFARYKLAWCQYNVGEYAEGFATLREVVLSPATSPRAVTLQDEAVRDLVRFAADGDLEDDLEEVFQRMGRLDLLRTSRIRLADTWQTQGRWEHAASLLARVIAQAPDAPDVPQLELEIVRTMERRGASADVVERLQTLRLRYGPQSAWAVANAADAAIRADAAERIGDAVRRTATALHTSRKPGEAELADGLYAAWIEDHPGHRGLADMRYAHAELLYKLRRYDAAYDEYMAVVAIDPAGKHAKFCAESAVFAAREVAAPLRRAQGAAPRAGLLPAEVRWLAALDQYVRLYPDDSARTQGMYYQAGYLHYQAGDTRAAAERFRTVIALNPGSRDAEQAAELILDGLAQARDWPTLKTTALAFSTQAGLGTPAFRADARVVAGNAMLEDIDAALLRTGDKATALVALEAFDAEFGDSPKAALALHNRAVYAEQLGLFTEVVEAREAILARHPKSPYGVASRASLGFAYESLAEFEKAASVYESLATTDSPAAADALYSAALFRAALGQPERAQADFELLARRWPTRPDAVGVRIEVARLLEVRGDLEGAARAWGQLVTVGTADEQLYARLRYGRLLPARGRASEAPAWWTASLAVHREAQARGAVGPVGQDAAAEMAFSLAEPAFTEAAALRMDGPGARSLPARKADALLQAQFAAKIRAVQELDRTYTDIIALGSTPWAIESLVRLGRASEDLSAAILASWVPTHLTESQRELYRMRLEDLAWAPRQRATEFYAAAADRGASLTYRSAATAFASARLDELRPEGGPLPVEQLPAATFLASAASARGYERE